MSDLFEAAEVLANLAEDSRDVRKIIAGIEIAVEQGEGLPNPGDISKILERAGDRPRFEALLYSMELAGIFRDDGSVAQGRIRDLSGAAMALHERGPAPENQVVVNLPVGEREQIGGSMGSLVVRLMELIGRADDSITILNPFFTEQVFDSIANPLQSAAQRGANITIMTRSLTYGSDGDNREFIKDLIDEINDPAGLTLYEYIGPEDDYSATIHAKMTLIDGEEAYLGTANLTHRGLRDNLEIGVIFRDDTVIRLSEFVDSLRGSKYLHEVRFDGSDFERV